MSIFQFKQFSVKQTDSAMKVGTDGTLLGAWVDCNQKENILDVGTGTGLIALMLAQRNSHANIDAIEIDKTAAEEADFNFKQSNWTDRLRCYHTALQEFAPHISYDLIVSNPPYFINSEKNHRQQKTTARHTDNLSFQELVNLSYKHLTSKGLLSIILPVNEANVFSEIAIKKEFTVSKRTMVFGNINAQLPVRTLLEFSKTPTEIQEDSITIEKDKRHSYTKEYKHLLKDFLLKF